VGACSGLPLSLEVMGRFLNGENFIPVWRDALTRLQNALRLQEDDMLWRTLRISIDDLEPIEREMLLNFADYFSSSSIGEEKGKVVLRRLVDKSLLKVDEHGRLVMHDLVYNMCQRIAMEEFMDDAQVHYLPRRVQNLPSQLLDVSKVKQNNTFSNSSDKLYIQI
jgi:predicted transcriptional regulator